MVGENYFNQINALDQNFTDSVIVNLETGQSSYENLL